MVFMPTFEEVEGWWVEEFGRLLTSWGRWKVGSWTSHYLLMGFENIPGGWPWDFSHQQKYHVLEANWKYLVTKGPLKLMEINVATAGTSRCIFWCFKIAHASLQRFTTLLTDMFFKRFESSTTCNWSALFGGAACDLLLHLIWLLGDKNGTLVIILIKLIHTLPATNSSPLKVGGLEDKSFLLGILCVKRPIFKGCLLLVFRGVSEVSNKKWSNKNTWVYHDSSTSIIIHILMLIHPYPHPSSSSSSWPLHETVSISTMKCAQRQSCWTLKTSRAVVLGKLGGCFPVLRPGKCVMKIRKDAKALGFWLGENLVGWSWFLKFTFITRICLWSMAEKYGD